MLRYCWSASTSGPIEPISRSLVKMDDVFEELDTVVLGRVGIDDVEIVFKG